MMNTMNLPMLLANEGASFADRTAEALRMVLMGMVMIFLVLSIIMLVLMLMERIFAKASKEKPVTEAPKAVEPAPAPAPVVQTQDDGAVIAAITAAISAVLAAENGTETYEGGFRVVSFKRSTRKSTWNSAK